MIYLPTIVAISTPRGTSGISLIRVSGGNSISLVDRIFQAKKNKKLSDIPSHNICYGHIIDRKTQGVVDEVLVSVMRAPHTYTREDVVEINSHGGYVSSQKILELVIREGAILAEAGEFTKRAFLSGRLDIAQAEAVADIIYAKTEEQARLAHFQLQGKLSDKINHIKNRLINLISCLEVAFDYPEEDIAEVVDVEIKDDLTEAVRELDRLLATYFRGKILKEGISTSIVGKPNVGKSTLYNLLVGRERVIVTDIPGTTRDVIEEQICLDDIFLVIKDTAGIRPAKNKIEKIGIEKTKKEIEASDMILFLVDTSCNLSAEDIEIANIIKDKKVIVILNKIDLPCRISRKKFFKVIESIFQDFKMLEVSLLSGEIEMIKKEILNLFNIGKISPSEIIISSLRHKLLLEDAKNNLERALSSLSQNYPQDMLSIDIREAITSMGKITGEVSSEDLLNNIFEKFCVGK